MSRDMLPVTALALSVVALGLSAYLLGSLNGVSSEIAEFSDSVEAIEAKVDAKPFSMDVAALEALSDRARIGQAKADLLVVKAGLGMYQAEDNDSRYPRTGSISSYADLRSAISPYVRLPGPEDVSFTFVAYTSAKPDTFVLSAKAKDKNRTLIRLTPTVITP